MDNKCPKCGEKLSLLYLKPNCPKCGCDIMYYNMESRLEADAEQAQKEWDKLERLIPKFIKKKMEKNDENN